MDLGASLFGILSFLSYRVVAVCLASVPITHVVGVYLHCPKYLRPWRYLTFPFTGGNRHIVLQLLGWSLWCLSALAILPVYLSFLPLFLNKDLPKIPNTHVDVVSGAAAVISLIGEVFMIKAILVHESPRRRSSSKGGAQLHQAPAHAHKVAPDPGVASAVVVLLGVVLSFTGSLLLLVLEYMPDVPSRVLYCCLSLSCLLVASSTTYGLGGFLRYGRPATAAPAGVDQSTEKKQAPGGAAGSEHGAGWSFYQPFAGGTVFVATQAVGWSVFAATIVLLAVLLQQLMAGVALCLRCMALAAGTLMVVAELVLALSLMAFRTNKQHPLLRAASDTLGLRLSSPGAAAAAGSDWMGRNMPVFLMYLPVYTFFTLWTASFTFMPFRWALTLWVMFLVPYYSLTMAGNPQHTGCRKWPWLMAWFENNIEAALTAWFGSVEVVMDCEQDGQGLLLHGRTTGLKDQTSSGTDAAAGAAGGARSLALEEEATTTTAAAAATSAASTATTSPAEGSSMNGKHEGSRAGTERDGTTAASIADSSRVDDDKDCSSTCSALASNAANATSSSSSSSSVGSIGGSSAGGAVAGADSSSPECSSGTTGGAAAAAAGGGGDNPSSSAGGAAGGGGGENPSTSAGSDPSKYIFGFQPHGLYPTGAGFLPWMPSFRRLFPGVHPVTLVASVLYIPPFIRDISCWAGFRQVTKGTFLRALKEQSAVILCPGGQAELVHTWRAFHRDPTKRQLVLYSRHKGFCRVAIEQQAALVPVLALGEALQLVNLFNFPALQQLTYKRIGFPVPFVLVGRWGLTPLPKKVPLVYVVGEPLAPPPHEPGTPVPQAAVDALHHAYYERLRGMWQRHHHRHPEFSEASLVIVGHDTQATPAQQ